MPHDATIKLRDGDQKLPEGGQEDVFPALIADIKAREQVGIRRYKQTLKTFDGRDNLRDAYEEALDLAVYLKKEIMQRDATRITTDS